MQFLRRIRESWRALYRDEAFRERMRFYRGIFLFHNLSDHHLALIVRAMMEKSYGEGEMIFQEGDVGRAFFVVAKGRVQLFHNNKTTGQPEPLADMGPGDFFGEMVLLDELPRSASARALEPATLYILYKSSFDALLLEAPRAASKFLHSLARLLSARLRRENFHLDSGNGAASPRRRLGAFSVLAKKFFQ